MTDQLTAADVAALRAAHRDADIEQARRDGKLNDLLGISRHQPAAEQWTQADVSRLFAERRFTEIEEARQAGHLANLMNGNDAA